MNNISKLIAGVFFISIIFSGCGDEDTAEVLKNIDTAGALLDFEGSSGNVLGTPLDMDNLEESEINFEVTSLTMVVDKAFDTVEEDVISHFEVVKQLNGGDEVSMGSFDALPFTFSLSGVSEFLEGESITASDLRIGDVFTFTVRVHQNDGDVYYYRNQAFNITVNCFADLTGTYAVTNSACNNQNSGNFSGIVNISQTPDGNWYLETADGGLLQGCTGNNLQNDGIITVVCRGEVLPTNSPAYCGSNGIGCITGGSWDQETGILTLELNDTFFGYGDYTATYVRQ